MFHWLRKTLANSLGAIGSNTARGRCSRPGRRRAQLSFDRLEDRLTPATPVTVGPNINVSKSPQSEQENAVIINPNNPLNLFATSTSGGAIGGVGYTYTLDGGVTWQPSNASALLTSAGDQQMAWDSFGNLFMIQLGLSGNNPVTTVGLSTDGGANFSLILNTNTFGDQPSIAVGANTVWVDYYLNGVPTAQGAAITGLGAVGTFSAPQAPGGSGGVFGDVAVGPNGQVMMVYQQGGTQNNPSDVFFALDPDGLGPQGFTSSTLIYRSNIGDFDGIPAQPNRTIDAEANLAWDKTNLPRRGRVYLVSADEMVDESSDTEIFVRFSDDNGTTWSTPVRVNDDPVGSGKSQFNPAIAVDQTTGIVAVTWYDARNSPGNDSADVWGSISRDGGVTWEPNVKISAGTTNTRVAAAQNFDFGDYDKMDFHAGVFYRAWTDNSNSTGDNPAGAGAALDLYIAQVVVPQPAGPVAPKGKVRLFNPVRFRRIRRTSNYAGLMTIVNYTNTDVTGPIYVIFKSLPRGVTVLNASGVTADGKVFIQLNRNLKVRKSFTFAIRVNNPLGVTLDNYFQNKRLTFTTADPTV